MLARLICFLLGHLLEDLVIRESPDVYIYMGDGKCVRCGMQVVEIVDRKNPNEERRA